VQKQVQRDLLLPYAQQVKRLENRNARNLQNLTLLAKSSHRVRFSLKSMLKLISKMPKLISKMPKLISKMPKLISKMPKLISTQFYSSGLEWIRGKKACLIIFIKMQRVPSQ